MNDRPIRLPLATTPHTAPEGYARIWMTQGAADGLYALLMWCQGHADAGKGSPPGYFETLMFYRSSLAGADWQPRTPPSQVHSTEEKP